MTPEHPTAKPVRTIEERCRMERIDAAVRAVAASFDASDRAYPILISRVALDRAGYPEAFPHLLLTAAQGAVTTDWCLSPAVCYHAFAATSGAVIAAPLVVTARGTCFRAENTTSPGVRQIEFEMREIVFMGSGEWVMDRADAARARIGDLAREFGLEGRWEPAEDPFFLPASRGKALLQRLMGLKMEYRSSAPDALALASVNRHGPFFGERFGIVDPRGRAIHSACVAVGLDRWCARATADRRITDVAQIPVP